MENLDVNFILDGYTCQGFELNPESWTRLLGFISL
jgi:hypothetical protein